MIAFCIRGMYNYNNGLLEIPVLKVSISFDLLHRPTAIRCLPSQQSVVSSLKGVYAMRIQDLLYFIQAAEAGSISQAAEQLYITQQGLSRILSSLSHELGVPLFTRKKSGFALTQQGKLVLEYAKGTQQAYFELLEVLRRNPSAQGQDGRQSQFTIYAAPLLCISLMPKLLRALQIRIPQVTFQVQEFSSIKILNDTELMPNNLGLINIPDFELERSERLKQEEACFSEFFQEPLWLQVPENFAQLVQGTVTKQELKSIPLAIFKANHYDQFEMLRHIAGDEPDSLNIIVHSSNQRLCQQLLESGQACGIGSVFYQRYYPMENTSLVPLEGAVTMYYGIVTKEKPEEHSITGEILRIMEMEVKGLKKESK